MCVSKCWTITSEQMTVDVDIFCGTKNYTCVVTYLLFLKQVCFSMLFLWLSLRQGLPYQQFLRSYFLLRPWTLIYDLDLRTWPGYGREANEQATYIGQRSRSSTVINPDTLTHLQLTECSNWTTRVVSISRVPCTKVLSIHILARIAIVSLN